MHPEFKILARTRKGLSEYLIIEFDTYFDSYFGPQLK